MKKILVLVLALSMLLSMFTFAFAEEPAELHFITRRRGNAYEENQVKQIIEEMFNVKIKWEILPSEGYDQACSVILSSGDYQRLWLDRCEKAYNLLSQTNEARRELLVKLCPALFLYGASQDLSILYFEDEQEQTYTISNN